jgi:7-carboxy-7-deazaguanine synthase
MGGDLRPSPESHRLSRDWSTIVTDPMLDSLEWLTPSEKRLRIAEIFESVQGEGLWAGVPSTFVRVSGCNLRCVWCDTPYASWRPEGPVRDLDGIVKEVLELRPRHLVITGGEPMLFQPVENLARSLADEGFKITIETAGTVFRQLPCHLMSISPKLGNSTPLEEPWRTKHEQTRIQLETLFRLMDSYPVQLKFVVSQISDIQEIELLLADLPPLEPEKILLMPEGRSSELLWSRARELVPICLDHGWRLAPRLQIDLFGDTRGT